jgi:hypothetical protein
MKKHMFASFLALILSLGVKAQFLYNLSVNNQTYAPLTSGVSLNGSTLWDDDDYSQPLGFNFNLNGQTVNTLNMAVGGQMVIDHLNYLTSPFSGMFVSFADLWDRGNASSSGSQSPIRYLVSGSAPNRIFKTEVFNAGFYAEYDLYSTNNDYINYQIWLYEGSEIIELRFGPSNITYLNDYYDPLSFAFFKNFDVVGQSVDAFYYLKGNPMAPTLDSTTNLSQAFVGLTAMPSDGTVYRFTPKTLNVEDVHNFQALIYPTVCEKEIFIENKEAATVQFRVSNIAGASIEMSGILQKGINNIDVRSLPTGTYILRLECGDRTKAVQILKK